ncbi:hypothetical protein IU11_11795 [Cellulosimicrobium sp. MM]|nr:hypothetical protein IU11_11795 [Cellulosimicrobium sp. MM]
MKSSTIAVTTPENAAPMTTPTARSIALPRSTNSLNPWNTPFMCCFPLLSTGTRGGGATTRARVILPTGAASGNGFARRVGGLVVSSRDQDGRDRGVPGPRRQPDGLLGAHRDEGHDVGA